MNFIEELKWRGLLQDVTPGLEEKMNEGSIKAYVGFDPTASSLTIGNLVSIMLLVHLQRCGHQPIVLLGGATGRIGDPSGKDKERSLLNLETIEQNINQQALQFQRFLSFEGPRGATMVNNYNFYSQMTIFEFLRDIGKQITVNYMLSKDSVKNRIESESGISFTEFSYQLIQGYDFQYLYHHHDCILQMGGADQWGNITTGTELVRKSGGKAYGLTCPLLTRSDGKKFGKSEEGNIWLDANLTSPYQFYQFWLNVSDQDLPKLLKIFSLKDRNTIENYLSLIDSSPNEIKKELAIEMTDRVHGSEALQSVVRVTELVFHPKLEKEFLAQLSAEEWNIIEKEIPMSTEKIETLVNGINIIDLLLEKHSSLPSKSEIKRAIKGMAISVNTEKVEGEDRTVLQSELFMNQYLFLQNGKKNKFIIKFI